VGSGLRVSGDKLVVGTDAGTPIHLHGVNAAGTEYACIQGWGFHDNPTTATANQAIRSWGSNLVRVPLNETCWLGINGAPVAYSGANYRSFIVNYVNALHAAGLYVELSLMWAAPGSYLATYQAAAPNADHSPEMWRQLAETFKNDPMVILAPYGETIVSASCFLNGCSNQATYGPNSAYYQTAGMQQAVDVMRAAGYNGPIAIPGIDYANNLRQWLSHKPNDPLNQLVAEAHVYYNNVCGTPACFDREHSPVAAQVPLLYGEAGPSYDDSDCGSANVKQIIDWADTHGVDGYAAWTWNTWGTCNSLITNFDGAPKGAYGSYVKAHYLALGP
jgi:endoglucanase